MSENVVLRVIGGGVYPYLTPEGRLVRRHYPTVVQVTGGTPEIRAKFKAEVEEQLWVEGLLV